MTDLHTIAERMADHFLTGSDEREGVSENVSVAAYIASHLAQVDADARRDELTDLLTLTENQTEARPHGEWEKAWASCQDGFKQELRKRIQASQERLEE